MDMMINKVTSNDDFPNIVNISFTYNDVLYNASYIPSENITIMLEKVTKYNNPDIYYKDSINMILINVLNRTHLKICSPVGEFMTADTDIATVAAMVTFKLGLTYSDLSVQMASSILDIML